MKRLPFFAALLLIIVAGAYALPIAAAGAHAAPPGVGQQAPGFTLRDQNGRRAGLAAAAGAKVVLVFYRGYW